MYFFEVWPSASCITHQSGSIWHCHRITGPPRLEMTPEVTQSNHPPNFSHWIPSLGATSEPFLCTCREISIQKAARSSCRRPALLVAVHFCRWGAESFVHVDVSVIYWMRLKRYFLLALWPVSPHHFLPGPGLFLHVRAVTPRRAERSARTSPGSAQFSCPVAVIGVLRLIFACANIWT